MKIWWCKFQEMFKIILKMFIHKIIPVDRIKCNSLNGDCIASVYNKITSFVPGHGHSRHGPFLVYIFCHLSSPWRNLGPSMPQRAVLWNLVWGFFTTAKPKQIEHSKLITLASGDAQGTRKAWELLSTTAGVFLLNVNFHTLGQQQVYTSCHEQHTKQSSLSRCHLAMSWKLEARNL